MNVGNKTHVAGLIVVLIAAIGYIAFQLKSRNRVEAPQATTTVAVTDRPETRTASFELPHSLYGDPFSAPKLAPAPSKSPAGKSKAGAAGLKPPPMPGYLNPAGQNSGSTEGDDSDSGGGSRPASPPIPGLLGVQASKNSKPKTLCLRGIVGAPNPVAFISIDENPPRTFKVGDSVYGSISVLQIAEGKIQLRLPTGDRALAVGAKLPIEDSSNAN